VKPKLEHVLLSVLTAAAIFVAVEAGLFIRDSRKAILFVESDEHTEAVKLDAVLTDVSRTVVIISGTATHIEKASRGWQTQQDALAKNAQEATAQLTSDLLALDTLESTANSLLLQQQKQLGSFEASASEFLNNTAMPIAQNLRETTANSAAATSTLSSGLSATMPQIEETVDNTAKTTAHIEGTTKDVQDFAHRELAPVKGTWNAIKAFLFEIAGPAASVATSLR
jgi:hypothetical protein